MSERVFISYSHLDSQYISLLTRHLTDAGLEVWTDEGIPRGAQWERTIEEQIKACEVLVPVMSPHSRKSAWVANEILLAQRLHKPILPLLLAGEPFTSLLSIQHDDVRGGRLPSATFVAGLRALTGAPATSPRAADQTAAGEHMRLAPDDPTTKPHQRSAGPRASVGRPATASRTPDQAAARDGIRTATAVPTTKPRRPSAGFGRRAPRRRLVAVTASAIAVTLLGIGGYALSRSLSSGNPAGSRPVKVGVILPDTAAAVRWEFADRPYLEQAFRAAGIEPLIRNAQGSPQIFQSLADELIVEGVAVLMIVNLDSDSGAAVLEKAKNADIRTIDYDRLTLSGGADYYVSFDNEAVGRLQGEGLVRCLTEKGVRNPIVAYLNGSPTDNNATLFRNGYDRVLKPKFDSGEYTKGPEDYVPAWDGAQAEVLFGQQFARRSGNIDGVLAANDSLASAAIAVLKREGVNGRVPVTGQDASLTGLRNILAGDQCMTVYKAIRQEAEAASQLAITLARNEQPTGLTTILDTESQRQVQAKLLVPVAIFRGNVKTVTVDNHVDRNELCTGEFADYCTELGI